MSVPLRVLILEDAPGDAELMVRELRRAGFAPEWQRVETEAEYLGRLDSALDLILADYSLPQFDAMRALRSVKERVLDIPLIVVTGSISEEVAVECIKQGAADYLLKDRLTRLGTAVVQALEQRRLRKEKRKTDELLKLQSTVLEAAANAIVIADRDGRIAWVNPAFTRLTGYTFQEVWGQNPRFLKSGRQDETFYRNLWETIVSGQVWSGEVVNRRKDGSLYTEEMTITPVRDDRGAVSHFIAIKEDITERKRAEEEIGGLARFPSENPTPILRLAAEGRILYANEASSSLLEEWRCTVGSLAPAFWQDIVHTALATRSGREVEVEYGLRVYSFFVAPIPAAGYVNLYGRDVTERTRAEEVLSESEERYRQLVEASPDAIILHDGERFLYLNPAGARLFGTENAHELVGERVLAFVDPADRETAREAIRHERETGELSLAKEVRLLRRDGRNVFVEVTRGPCQYGDKRMVQAIFRDVTERKQAEEALRRYVERLKSIHAIDRAILGAGSPPAIAKAALHYMQQLVPCQGAGAALFDFAAREATVLANYSGTETLAEMGTLISLEDFAVLEELRQGKVHTVGDVLAPSGPPQLAQILLPEGVRSYFSVPLIAKGELIGCLTMGWDIPEGFSLEHVDIAREVADQVAIAIYQARLRGAAARRGEELTALLRATRSIMSGLDLQGILERIVEEAAAISGCQHVKLLLVDKPGEILRTMATKGTAMSRGDELPLGTGLSGLVAATGQPLFVPDCPRDARNLVADKDREMGLVTYLGLPITVREEVVGVLTFNTTAPHEYGPGELAYLASYADQAAIAIENARLYEKIRRHAAELEDRVQERTHELEAANQQLQDASRHKSEFLANMSHEIRTPLNSIIGFSDLLQDQHVGPLNEKQARYITHISNGGKHLLQLIGDILDLSKVEAGRFVLQPELLPIAQTLEDILVIARGLANKKAQEIQAAIAPDLPPLHADPVRFKQILFNLLSNAVKFTPDKGTITLRAYQKAEGREQKAESRRQKAEGSGQTSGELPPLPTAECPLPTAYCLLPSLVIEVTDTGVGIRPEDLPRLFQEFVQLETTQAQKHEGTGLGLALSKRLVELHGGRIWAESEGEGRGSTFTVVLPFAGPGT